MYRTQRAKRPPRNDVDVIVVGGGIAGLMTAYEILDRNPALRVLIAERANIGAGATGLSGGHIVHGFQGDPEVNSDSLNDLTTQGLRRLVEVIEREKIECGLSMGYLYLANGLDGSAALGRLQESKKRQGLTGLVYLNRQALSERLRICLFDCALFSRHIGHLNPRKLITELGTLLKKKGADLQEGLVFKNAIETPNGVIVQLGSRSMSASYTILAGGVEQANLNPRLKSRIATIYTCAVSVGPMDESAYLDVLPTGEPIAFCDLNISGNVLWGSIDDNRYLQIGLGEGVTPLKTEEIRKTFDSLFPYLASFDKRYRSGALAVTSNGLPIVGRWLMKSQRIIVCNGWAGKGLVPSVAAAVAIAKYIAESDDRQLTLFESMRGQRYIPPIFRHLLIETGVLMHREKIGLLAALVKKRFHRF
jgi:glycine/D-amino acid oxidase-like deaminating enzyme